MRLVYAGVGAAVATVVCVVIMLGMMRFATSERPDSLAAIVTSWSRRRSNARPTSTSSDAPAAARGGTRGSSARTNQPSRNAVFALDAVVTHQSGHLANLERAPHRPRAAAGQGQDDRGRCSTSVTRASAGTDADDRSGAAGQRVVARRARDGPRQHQAARRSTRCAAAAAQEARRILSRRSLAPYEPDCAAGRRYGAAAAHRPASSRRCSSSRWRAA